MIFHFILNPKSGKKRRYRHLEDTIVKACTAKNIKYKIHYTYGHDDATEYVAQNAKATDENEPFSVDIVMDGLYEYDAANSPEERDSFKRIGNRRKG